MPRWYDRAGDRRSRASRSAWVAGALAAVALAAAVCPRPAGAQPTGIPSPQPRTTSPPPGPPAGVPVFPGAVPVFPLAAAQPAPKPLGQPNPLANPLLSPAPPGLARSPVPTPATQEKVAKYVAKLLDPETTLDLVAGQTRVMILKGQPFRVQAGEEAILTVNAVNPRELLLQGKAVGATVLNIWFGDKDDPTKQEVLTYLVRVFPDPEAKERLEKAYKALEDEINRYFQDCSVRLKIVGDKLVVSGRVRDYVQGGQILQIIRANQAGQGGGVGDLSKIPLSTPGGPADPTGGTNPPLAEAFQAAGGPNVINLLQVAGEQQVMLRVLVAEVNRAAARSVGLNFNYTNRQGITVFSNTTGPVGGAGGFNAGALGSASTLSSLAGGLGSAAGFGGAIPNLNAAFDAGRIPIALNAMKTLQYARSLAEPTLVTMNGVPANFLAGGQFPVPVIGGFGSNNVGGGGGLQGVQYVPFGVQLSFTPFITDRDRVKLNFSATVSTRDLSAGTNIGGGNVAGLNSRNVNTTVELRQGETLAVAGLIEYNQGADATKVPFLGDIPGLNVLTGLQRVQSGEKELVIFITPELVRPLDPGQTAPLPGAEILDPTDLEFYLMGRIEGHCRDFRSPTRTDLSRIKMYRRVEQTNVYGPAGYSPQQYP